MIDIVRVERKFVNMIEKVRVRAKDCKYDSEIEGDSYP
jgi:hypothetical protein